MRTLSTRAFREQTCAVRTASAYTALAGWAALSFAMDLFGRTIYTCSSVKRIDMWLC